MRSLMLAVLALTALSGCGSDDEARDASDLTGVPWTLESGLDVEGWEHAPPSATFVAGKVSGSTGCNRFTASYELGGSDIELGPIASTEMACEPPANAVERAYLGALDRVAGWRVSGEKLALLDGDGSVLLRFGMVSLTGSWKATSFLQGDGVTGPLAGTEVTATFDASGTLSGTAGCNRYRAAFTADRGTVEIGRPERGDRTCAEPAGVMEQERAYLAALPLTASYRVEGPAVSLLTAKGTFVATYERAP